MLNKQNLLATLAAAVTLFLAGWIIWGMATMEFFQIHSNPGLNKSDTEMNLGITFLGNLVIGFMMSSIYGTWSKGQHSLSNGLKFGAWFGLFVGTGLGLVYMGTSNMMDTTGHLVEAALELGYHGLVGIVIAVVYMSTQPKKA